MQIMILQQSSELPFCCTNRSLDIGLLHGIHSQSDLVRPKYVKYIECCIRLGLFQQYKMENCQLPVKVPLMFWLLLLSLIMMSQHTVSRILFKCNSSKDDLSFATNIISFCFFLQVFPTGRCRSIITDAWGRWVWRKDWPTPSSSRQSVSTSSIGLHTGRRGSPSKRTSHLRYLTIVNFTIELNESKPFHFGNLLKPDNSIYTGILTSLLSIAMIVRQKKLQF